MNTTLTVNELKVLFLKLDRLRIGYRYNKEESSLEIGGVNGNKTIMTLAAIGLLLISVLFLGWILFLPEKIVPIIALIAVYSYAIKYFIQYSEQKANRFKITPSKITVYQGDNEIHLTSEDYYHIRIDVDRPDTSEFSEYTNMLLSGRLLLTYKALEIKLISISGENANLIDDDLTFIHSIVIRILGSTKQ